MTGLKKVEWNERYDAKELCEAMKQLEQKDIYAIEKQYFEILKIKNFEKNKEKHDLFGGDTNMPSERLEFVKFKMEDFEKENKGEIMEENWEEFDNLLWNLGDIKEISI